MYVGSVQYAGDAKRKSTVGSGGMTTSWLGFSGTEDLGGGLKAHFALDSFVRMDTGASARFNGDNQYSRNANIALSGSFGRVTIGRFMAPGFLPTVLVNPLGDSFAFSPLVLHNYVGLNNGTNWSNSHFGDTGWSSQVRYSSPTIGGFSTNLQYQFAESGMPSGARNVGGNLSYSNGPLNLTGYYERVRIANPSSTYFADGAKRTAWLLGGSYDATVVKLYGSYGETKLGDNAPFTRKTTSLGASMPMGAGSLSLAYAHTKENALDRKRQTATLGYMHHLSKRTRLYTNLMHDKITNTKSGTSFALGIMHKF